MIRPAKCHFNGFMKPSIKGADKNHNPRKGTETLPIPPNNSKIFSKIRTIIPVRGRVRKKQLNRRSSPCWENVDD